MSSSANPPSGSNRPLRLAALQLMQSSNALSTGRTQNSIAPPGRPRLALSPLRSSIAASTIDDGSTSVSGSNAIADTSLFSPMKAVAATALRPPMPPSPSIPHVARHGLPKYALSSAVVGGHDGGLTSTESSSSSYSGLPSRPQKLANLVSPGSVVLSGDRTATEGNRLRSAGTPRDGASVGSAMEEEEGTVRFLSKPHAPAPASTTAVSPASFNIDVFLVNLAAKLRGQSTDVSGGIVGGAERKAFSSPYMYGSKNDEEVGVSSASVAPCSNEVLESRRQDVKSEGSVPGYILPSPTASTFVEAAGERMKARQAAAFVKLGVSQQSMTTATSASAAVQLAATTSTTTLHSNTGVRSHSRSPVPFTHEQVAGIAPNSREYRSLLLRTPDMVIAGHASSGVDDDDCATALVSSGLLHGRSREIPSGHPSDRANQARTRHDDDNDGGGGGGGGGGAPMPSSSGANGPVGIGGGYEEEEEDGSGEDASWEVLVELDRELEKLERRTTERRRVVDDARRQKIEALLKSPALSVVDSPPSDAMSEMEAAAGHTLSSVYREETGGREILGAQDFANDSGPLLFPLSSAFSSVAAGSAGSLSLLPLFLTSVDGGDEAASDGDDSEESQWEVGGGNAVASGARRNPDAVSLGRIPNNLPHSSSSKAFINASADAAGFIGGRRKEDGDEDDQLTPAASQRRLDYIDRALLTLSTALPAGSVGLPFDVSRQYYKTGDPHHPLESAAASCSETAGGIAPPPRLAPPADDRQTVHMVRATPSNAGGAVRKVASSTSEAGMKTSASSQRLKATDMNKVVQEAKASLTASSSSRAFESLLAPREDIQRLVEQLMSQGAREALPSILDSETRSATHAPSLWGGGGAGSARPSGADRSESAAMQSASTVAKITGPQAVKGGAGYASAASNGSDRAPPPSLRPDASPLTIRRPVWRVKGTNEAASTILPGEPSTGAERPS